MRPFSTLPCLVLAMWSTALAAAGPGAPQRRPDPAAQKAEVKKQPTPAPQAAAKPAASKPVASKPAASKPKPTAEKSSPPKKPFIAKTEPPREKPAVTAPPPKPVATAAPATRGAAARPEIPRSVASVEPATTRRALRESSLWLSAVQAQHSDYTARLTQDQQALGRLTRDASFSALPTERNRNEAAIPAAAALRAHSQRDWTGQFDAQGSRPAPIAVEQLMRQGESIAFRTSTSTADTQGLVAKIRRTPGVAAGGHLGFEAMAPDLLTAHLRIVPGTLSAHAPRQPYAVQNADAIRGLQTLGRADLEAQFAVVRRDWLVSAMRADELQKKYLQLRTALVAPDAE
jgi:outer membrane biosynthesis protein TonB